MIGTLVSLCGRAIVSLRYRITFKGYKDIASKGKKGILFLPNHPAFIDPVIMVTQMHPRFKPSILADRDQVDLPVLRSIAKKLHIIPMADPAVYGEKARAEVESALAQCGEVLRQGKNVMLYPAGHTSYSRYEELGGSSGVETLLKACPDARIVLIRISGLWGSRFSRSEGVRPDFFAVLKKGIAIVFSNLIFFTPRRKVVITCKESNDFPRTKSRAEMNRYMEEFYNADMPPRTYVPYHIWERGGTRELPELSQTERSHDIEDIPDSVKNQVLEKISEVTGVSDIAVTAHLARDLGMDSLMKIELLGWVESEFGISAKDPEAVQTVTDVMRAAFGATSSGTVFTLKAVPSVWFKKDKRTWQAVVPEGKTIPEVFLKQAKKHKADALIADQARGVMTYSSLVLAVMVLRNVIRKLEGEYIGIMLPSLGLVHPLILSVQFAGKIPVMINWTVGERSITHSLKLLGVKKILTSKVFMQKLEEQGLNLSSIKDSIFYLEDLGHHVGTFAKIGALIKSKLSWNALRKVEVKDTAVVLFTSGSESLPKAVPLSHENILTNVRDAVNTLYLKESDVFIGFLPPFHSFGLTATYMVTLCAGMRSVYHPNPTEGLMVSKVIGAYRATILAGTPTFLDGITRSTTGNDIDSIRLVVSGAEKCPLKLYEYIASRWPSMNILEGYGITECSPIVSVNRFENPKKGTIGIAMPAVEYVIRDIDTGKRVEHGSKGMLFVRGKSIFSGYLNFDGESPFEEFEGKQWYRTGDLVSEDADGVFTFAGRLKRFVKLGGEMISLPAIEEILLKKFQQPDQDIALAVESSASETNPEVILFCVPDISREAANQTLREAGLSALHNIRVVKRIDKIPVLGTGKTDYRSLKGRI
jgi:acyl-CoA synthetase (AMP-forming)/AMP-acid ligase II/1-acyl-sn-glycerol-3-phosphate acyltransferase/acyl carrier protein